MPDLGPLGVGLILLICVLPIVVSALFIFILLKVISSIRGSRELGDRIATTPAQPPSDAAPTEDAVREEPPRAAGGDGSP